MAKTPNDPQPVFMGEGGTVNVSVADLQKIFAFLDEMKLSSRLASAAKKKSLTVTLPSGTVNQIKKLVAADETARKAPIGKKILYPSKATGKRKLGIEATMDRREGCCGFSSDG
jgi:hypothetical protein